MNVAVAERASASALPLVLIRALRPRQWTKNFAALAPLLFAKAVFQTDKLVRGFAAVAVFCLVAGGVYILNDWVDREKDLLHPEKRKRPIASGQLGPAAAFALLAVVWIAGFSLAYWVAKGFLLIAAGYAGMQIAYSLVLKRVVILDVMIVATGFILRVGGGGVAINVDVSNWLLLCTLLLALFLGFSKRRSELASLQGDAGSHRESLDAYSLPFLDQMIGIVAAANILAYGLYTVSAETVSKVGSDGLKFTLPFVIYGLFRYLFLVHKRGGGGSPERILLSDVPTIVNLALYVSVAAFVLYRH